MQGSSKSGLFLIELIVVIVFFAVASAICTQIFVYSHNLSTKSRDINMAVNAAQSAAECFKADPLLEKSEMAGLLSGTADESSNSVVVFYDKEWTTVDDGITPKVRALDGKYVVSGYTHNPKTNGVHYPPPYYMIMTLDTAAAPALAEVRVYEGERLLYEITVKKYIQEGAGQ